MDLRSNKRDNLEGFSAFWGLISIEAAKKSKDRGYPSVTEVPMETTSLASLTDSNTGFSPQKTSPKGHPSSALDPFCRQHAGGFPTWLCHDRRDPFCKLQHGRNRCVNVPEQSQDPQRHPTLSWCQQFLKVAP